MLPTICWETNKRIFLQQEPGLELAPVALAGCSAVPVAPEETWVLPQIFVSCELRPRRETLHGELRKQERLFHSKRLCWCSSSGLCGSSSITE